MCLLDVLKLILLFLLSAVGARVVPHDPNHSLMRPWIEGDADVWVYKDENEKFVMPCFAHADPDPDVTWYKYHIRVTPDYRRHIREDHSMGIEIADMMDTGTYQCRAANQYGMARKTYHVIIMIHYTNKKKGWKGPPEPKYFVRESTSKSLVKVRPEQVNKATRSNF